MNILGCVDLWICDIVPNFSMCFLYLCPLRPDLIRTHIFLFICIILHFFEFFLRKNLQKLKCLTYLCIGFRKHPVPPPKPCQISAHF